MGVEPIRCCHHGILSPARLPIPSRRLIYRCFRLQRFDYITNYGILQIFFRPQSNFFETLHYSLKISFQPQVLQFL